MSKKIVTVVGATGSQGGSIVRTLVKDGGYTVRAVTRNPSSAGGQELANLGAIVVKADVDDYDSLVEAFAGSHVIFGVTNFYEQFGSIGPEKAVEIEIKQGINLAKAAAATETLQHYIWSTLPNAQKISNGKHDVAHYTGKNAIDDYIKSNDALFRKTTFFWVTFYASNILFPMFKPFTVPTAPPNTYIQIQSTSEAAPIKMIGDAKANVGIFAKKIIEKPELTLPSKFVIAEVETLTAGEFLSSWAKAQGKEAKFIQVEKSTYFSIWPMWANVMDRLMSFYEDYKDLSWSGEDVILTRKDLGIDDSELVKTSVAMAQLGDSA